MRSKILAIVIIFVFSVYDFAYAHSGRTNSSGCHNVTATGGYHCHNGGGSSGSSSSSSSRYSESENDTVLLLGLAVIVIGVGYWAYTTDWGKNPQACGCLLSHTPTQRLYHRTPMPLNINSFKLPDLNLNKQGISGWQLKAAYTYHF